MAYGPVKFGSGLDFGDLYCGAGGSSAGLTEAGYELVIAVNHWPRAIETHSANFTSAEHWCTDINKVDMRRLPRTRILWASPICTESTPAGGQGTRPKGQLDIFEQDGHIDQPGFERTRATFHDVIRATEVWRYDAVVVENVVDVAGRWELFDWWVQGMTLLGYNCQFLSVSSAHIGGEDNPRAPQWRDRLYIVLTKIGIPLPDLDPRPMAWCPVCEVIGESFQSWKNPAGRKIGKYGRQYVYRHDSTACRHAIAEPLVLPAAAAIDWSDLGTPIGERKKTKSKPEGLAPSTMRRIRAGRHLLGRPVMLVAAGASTYEHPGPGCYRLWSATDEALCSRTGTAAGGAFVTLMRSGRIRNIGPWDEPLATIVTEGSNHGLVVPVGGNNHDAPARGTDEPMCTRVVRDTDALVVPSFVAELRSGLDAREAAEPLTAAVARAGRALTVRGALYAKNCGGNCLPEDAVTHVASPAGPLTARDHYALVVPYRKGRASTAYEPLHTVATRESAGLVSPGADEDVSNWRYRMLRAREHLRAQRFRDDYIVTGTQGEQTMQAGNAVSVNAAHHIGKRLKAVL